MFGFAAGCSQNSAGAENTNNCSVVFGLVPGQRNLVGAAAAESTGSQVRIPNKCSGVFQASRSSPSSSSTAPGSSSVVSRTIVCVHCSPNQVNPEPEQFYSQLQAQKKARPRRGRPETRTNRAASSPKPRFPKPEVLASPTTRCFLGVIGLFRYLLLSRPHYPTLV